MNKIMWWGYLHSNGTIQCKRWLGDVEDYTTDCNGNPYVKQVVVPFEAENQEAAMQVLKEKLL